MKKLIVFFLILFSSLFSISQSKRDTNQSDLRSDYRIVFYNVENLFDTKADSLKNDTEFLPQGQKHWTWAKYQNKCTKTAKIIMAIGAWQLPEIIGLCEVENRKTLHDILYSTPLRYANYRIIHRDSPDHRGMDIALLYQADRFFPIDTSYLELKYAPQQHSSTREIVYVKGTTHTDDTLHLFVNHWPSRWGGQLESEYKRLAAAKLLKNKTDSILNLHPKSNLIIMGDFNDYPNNKSIAEILNCTIPEEKIEDKTLYNLASHLKKRSPIASHKYKGVWGMLDQFIVSGALINKCGLLYCKPEDMHLFCPPYLLENDKSYFGIRPYRTYIGYKYHGGFSDHLPIYLDLWRNLDDED